MGVFGDIGDGLNKGLGYGEHLVEEGKKKVGEGVDWATNKVGDCLDHVGLHAWADGVEDWGDGVASDLGATPGEQQLGQTEEANELVHGDPGKIGESAMHLTDFHAAFDKVSAGLTKVDSSGWKGEGGEAFREKFGVHPAKWAQASAACEEAAGALEAYAHTVTWAQGQAKEAIALYKKGTAASKDAVDAYNKTVDAYNAKIDANQDPGPKPDPFVDPGTADVKAARDKLAEARKQRNTAASEAQGKIKTALAHAPAEPPPWRQGRPQTPQCPGVYVRGVRDRPGPRRERGGQRCEGGRTGRVSLRSAGKTGTRPGVARRNRNPPEAPAGDHRQAGGNLRPLGRRGCQSWGSADEAARYAERLRGRGADVEILHFKISDSDFSALRKADVVNMPPAEAEAFVDKYSRLYGSGESHDFD